MSSLILEAGTPSEILDHPNADRMKVAVWKGWNCCVDLEMTTETPVVYFQPDLLLPHDLAEELGVTPYLKKLGKDYPDRDKWAGRVSVARLRSVPSYGILARVRPDWIAHLGNLPDYLGVGKYDPPEKVGAGDSERDSVYFGRYTDIENLRNFPDTFEDGEQVVITEKIHGTNCRIGFCPESRDDMIPADLSWNFMAGSHSVRRKDDAGNTGLGGSALNLPIVSLYWKPFEWYPQLYGMLAGIALNNDEKPVIIYGEIYGSGVQDLKYGLQNSKKDFRIFDIKVGDVFLDYADMIDLCRAYEVPTVPTLYMGAFSWETMERYAEGNSYVCDETQMCEGIVIRPVKETVELEGRKIRKLIGFNYLNRRGGSEDH